MQKTIRSQALIYRKFGDPLKVLQLETVEVPAEPGSGECLVEWLASPINPLDINRIQGNYAVRAELPVIGGSEGVGRVVKAGSGSRFKSGDHVTIFSANTPIWTEFGVVDDDELVKLDNRIPLDLAATLMINPPTAWIMLKKYVNLQKGDYIIQNSANSGVGRSVIEMCKALGYKSINIVRNRQNIEALKTDLWRIGADHVFTEEEFKGTSRQFLKSINVRPKLALNGVGGKSALQISSVLERGGTCVTYGGMSKKAHEFTTSALVFNDICVRGVAVGMWARQEEHLDEWNLCVDEVQKLAVAGKITAIPMEKVVLADHKTAIQKSLEGRSIKQLFVINSKASASHI
ncbi:Enoyl-[acyl-carrier-protein] reductase, mitochondrial [Caenorhabditis elegans]|uniref:Enoyl-[acyl-carrier-protein] reductase, mitochondrial n=2 Tax=Caenorhabditis elegans TaxID=6239 RepID=MECR2_CAEEL|nr:Enoyl-[acyl-carrier-protein] reductase, mitochondrial [Caenorhabditis elegans]Q9XXC8.1 RecName: Full=Enoyl-[acyl-carrier-protein] reductase, mitochondrial; AltName: Full=2-enoyl thioester reductase; Flags: Precursor [Caenorhabditis elegans]CAA19533.1 Enoyl-[acyl-carrier-protein] reductase, mitochondrial [Caenorhabditis elegans]|eukprot:NP_001255097.1 Enoyl-[acyl-carrier-protein] reductase, mitochondrial [Caenorhabditis elegans]